MISPRLLIQLSCCMLLCKAFEDNDTEFKQFTRHVKMFNLKNLTCARACKKVIKLQPDMKAFDREFYYNVSIARKNELIQLSQYLFDLEFRVSEVKIALDAVQEKTSCTCPRVRNTIAELEMKFVEAQDTIAVRFDEIKRDPDLRNRLRI